MPGPAGVPRGAIIALIREGHSDRYIGRVLHTNPKRAGRIRREEGLEASRRESTLTLRQAWTTYTRPSDDGHLVWAGPVREGVPCFQHHGRSYTARRVAFTLARHRDPIGRVKAGCGRPDCVEPAHIDDQQMRNHYKQIFGSAV